ncbi:MAG TPA: hypothetical protein VK663_15735, partial [Burkholderiales bacterium]|nr:hypothetical protein [Burkholderiales bacterium]
MMKSNLISRVAGALLLLLGASVMTGWLLQLPSVVRVLPGFAPMVFNTALCFCLAGGVLILPAAMALNYKWTIHALGSALIIVAVLILAEHLFKVDLGVDWIKLHAWLADGNHKAGRMSAASATGFLMSGVTFIFVTHALRQWTVIGLKFLTAIIGIIGAFALVGHMVSARLLFPDYPFSDVALHSALGFVLLSGGLWNALRHFQTNRSRLFQKDDDHITFVGATVLIGITFSAGVASFVILQGRVQTVVADYVLAALSQRSEVFQDMIALHEGTARIAATRPAVIRNLRLIQSTHDDGSNIANVKAVIDSFLRQGFSGFSYHAIDGKVVASGGTFSKAPALSVTLATSERSELLWDHGFLLRHRIV